MRAALLGICFALLAFAGSGAPQGVQGEAQAELRTGVEVRFESRAGVADSRLSRLVALYVPADSPPTPFLQRGPFRATFESSLELGLNDSFWFGVEGRGGVRLVLRGEEVLAVERLPEDGTVLRTEEEIDLRKGGNELVVEYTSPTSGPAELRLSWGSEVLPPEPVPPEVLRRPPLSAQLAKGLERRRGRDRFAERLCVRCHRPLSLVPRMPELATAAPDWERLGRLRPEWVERWLLDPTRLRPEARMPRLLSLEETMARSQAADIAAYLAREPMTSSALHSSVPQQGVAAAGERLYAELGCESCHELRDLGAKWRPEGLVSYLIDPTAHERWNRMPRFALDSEEAAHLAAFLLEGGEPTRESAFPEGDPERGERWVTRLRCLYCHGADPPEAGGTPPVAALEQLAESLERGCLASEPAGGAHPDFALGAADLAALRSFLGTGLDSLGRRVWEEFATRQVVSLDCAACHARDGEEARWSGVVSRETGAPDADTDADRAESDFWRQDAAEEDAPQIAPPHLTFAGEKLRLSWLEPFLAGELDHRPRPHLQARMPAFPNFAPGLARGLLEQHGYGPGASADRDLSPELVAIGADLISGERLGCQSCHAQGEVPALGGEGQQETINFAYVGERLRRSYFDRFLRDPQRILPGTKMPQFVDEDGYTALYDVFDGEAQRQFDAIWQYLHSLSSSRRATSSEGSHGRDGLR